MTNYDKLVKRLHSGLDNMEEAAYAITRLQADLKEAVEALRPLHQWAELTGVVESTEPDYSDYDITVDAGDMRRAAAIVAKHEGDKQ